MRRYSLAPTPLGDVLLSADGTGRLAGVHWPGHRRAPRIGQGWVEDDAHFGEVRAQLDAYFAGERTAFDLDVVAQGTPFQQRVWAALRDIPYGVTVTYATLAEAIGRRGSARAVGMANGSNPLSIVVPCHRVIGTSGGLTGYAGGLAVKERLLAFEARARNSDGTSPWWRRNALANCAGS